MIAASAVCVACGLLCVVGVSVRLSSIRGPLQLHWGSPACFRSFCGDARLAIAALVDPAAIARRCHVAAHQPVGRGVPQLRAGGVAHHGCDAGDAPHFAYATGAGGDDGIGQNH
jgi:hypothetical protein